MYDSRNNLSRHVVSEVKAHFSDGVFDTVIPRNVKLSESPSHGKPALLYDISSTGSQSYLSLAQDLLRRVEGIPVSKEGPAVTQPDSVVTQESGDSMPAGET